MRPGRAPLLLPLLLVAAGVVLLLANFGLVPSVDLLRYWPILVILAGLQLLLRGDLGLTWQMQTFGITRGTVQTASLEANSGELDMRIRALRREGRLIAGQYTGRSRPDLDVREDHARLVMERGRAWPFSQADWEVGLAKDLPWTLAMSAHLGEMDVDLRGLNVPRADLATGIGDIKVVASDQPDVVEGLRARSTFGNVTLSIPEGVEGIVRIGRRPLGRTIIDEKRYLMVAPGLYATLHWEDSSAPVYVDVASTFGTVRLQ